MEGGSSLAEILGLDRWPERLYATEIAWNEGFAELKAYSEQHGISSITEKTETSSGFPVGRWLRAQLTALRQGDLLEERYVLLASLPGWEEEWADLFDLKFARGVACVAAFIAEHGRMPLLGQEWYQGQNIGSWVQHQRLKFQRKELSRKEIRTIEAIPGWTWNDYHTVEWYRGLEEAAVYLQEHDHIQVTRQNPTLSATGYNLSKWLEGTKSRYKRKTLTTDQVRSLRRVGIDPKPRTQPKPDERVGELREYLAKHHLAKVRERRPALARWVRGIWGKPLPLSLKRDLNATPGWFWSHKEALFDCELQGLVRFIKARGEPRLWCSDGKAAKHFRKWVRSRAKEYHAQLAEVLWEHWTLPLHVQRSLYEIPRLREHIRKHGYPKRRGGHKLDRSLWSFRERWIKDGLNLVVRNALASLPGFDDWAESGKKQPEPEPKAQWNAMFKRAKAWTRHSSLADLLRTKDPEGLALKKWYKFQVQLRSLGVLPADRSHRLEQLPHFAWRLRQICWNRGLAVLRKHLATHGRTQGLGGKGVLSDGFPLGAWVATARTAYKQKKLPPERIAELEALPLWRWKDPPGGGAPRKFDYARIKKLHASGLRTAAIAQKVGCSPSHVQYVMNRN